VGVRVDIDYEGNLHSRAVHEPSGSVLATDAPRDNQGLGASFSPTDLVGTALGTCMLTTMAIAARAKGIELKGASASVDKDMIADPKRRVAKLTVAITMPASIDKEMREHLEHVAHTCPVALTLSERTQVVLSFTYG
jgi:putative redox protein